MDKLLDKAKTSSIRRWPVGLLAAALVVSVSAAPNSTKTGDKKSPSASTAPVSPVAKLKTTLADMPLAFEANQGQTDASVKFLTRTQNFTVFLTPQETVLRGRNADVLRMQLRNANQSPSVVGEDKQLKITNYFIGDRSTWHANIPNYGQVRYQDVYSGIDMVYHSDQRQLEYDFVVKPGADPNQIRIAFEGATDIHIAGNGDLELKSIAGKSVNHKPLIYQTIAGKRKLVDGEFILANNNVGFKLGQYDRTQPLVIDPTLQVLAFFGGTANDEAAAIATTANVSTGVGIVFVGRAESPALPTAGGALSAAKTTVGLSWDAFATGLNGGTAGVVAGAGTTIAWTTYFGGSGDDAARAVAMDNSGNTYVTGYTNSVNFLGTLTSSNYDAFLVKLGTGGAIGTSTLYGGPGVDQGTSIALDYSTFSGLSTAGSIANPATDPRVTPNVVIGGVTSGSIGQPGSPTSTTKTPDGYQPTFNYPQSGAPGTTDGFVAIFSSTLTLIHATYVGGGGNDQVNGVAADVWGNIYVTGYATPNVAALIPPATIATFFPVVNGITGGTNLTTPPGTTPPPFTNVDASRAPQGAATAFVVKFGCTTGTAPNGPIGVGTSPPFGLGSGYTSPFPLCNGGNNLKTLSNSALFGGSAGGNANPTFINPDQVANGLPGITEAGLGIAVDQNGWGQEGVSGTFTAFNGWGFADIVPNGGSASALGFQPGLSGPHVYIVGATASSDFVTGLLNPACLATDSAGVQMCTTPEVWGSTVLTNGGLPVPACDPISVCPVTVPNVNLRVKTVANGASNSGQTQGWLASFQLPGITTEIVTPPPVGANIAPTTSVNTLNPPTIPNYIVLQPLTCPQQAPNVTDLCLPGSNVSIGVNGTGFTNTSPAPAFDFGCAGGTPTGVSCPAAYIGSWNAVTVDSDQQVYVVGQIGLTGTRDVINAGAPTRLALEIERISPYAQTSFNGNTGVLSGLCGGPPCAFPEPIFPNATSVSASSGLTSSFIVDALNGGSVYGASLPASPPKPDPNQPGGIGNGIAVNPFREAFFVGTTSAVNGAGGTTATATAIINAAGQIAITVVKAGAGYTTAPTITLTGLTSCTTTPGPFTVTIAGGAVSAIANNPSGAGCLSAGLTVTFTAAPGAGFPLGTSPITIPVAANAPIPVLQNNLGTTGGSNNSVTPSTEDVVFGAIQFYDAISAIPPNTNVVNFTATVNSIPSITGPNSTASDPSTMGLGARGIITYYDESGQVLNIPPGCQVFPATPAGQNGPAFTVTQIGNTASFQVSVAPGAVNFPGVVSNLIAFAKTPGSICTGLGQPLDSWDPIMATLTVSAPLNVSSEDTFGTISNPLTTGLLTGLIDQYVADGRQLINNTPIIVPLDVETAATPTNAPINFTVQIVPGVNWAGAAVNAVTVPTPTYTIYPAGGTAATAAHIPVTFNTIVMASLPQGTYTAYILVTPTPETPALGAPGSLQCGATIIGTSNATCVPVVFKVNPVQNANIPGAIVFGASQTPQQTGLTINNPINSSSTFNFTTFYVPTPVLGTALPAANVFYVGTGSTLTPAIGNTVAGSIAVGGSDTIPIQVNPVGLTTGVYSGQLLVSNTGLVTGATAQTSVPLIVYIGPKSGDDAPTGAGLGLTLPVNVPPVGTGALPGTVAGETPGAYALTLNVASGFGPSQVSDPTLIEVTGLSNTATSPYFVNAPVPLASNKTSVLPGVIVTNTTNGALTPALIANTTGCGPTNAQLNSLGNSPLGPPCVWSVWVDATTLNSTNTVRTTACGVDPVSLLPQFGESGYLRFTQIPNGMLLNGVVVNGLPFATLDVPITVCVTDEPALILGMPQTFPNPTFGPIDSSSTDNFIAQPSNLTPGFSLSIVEMQLAASSGSSFGPTVSPAISLFAQQFNSGLVCKTLDIHTNGGNLFGVTFNPLGSGPGAFLTLGTAPAVFTGLLPAYANPFVVEALTAASGGTLTPAPGSPFGPFNVSDEMQVFQICANTDNLGNAVGTFTQNFIISGGQVGPITVPVNFTIGPANGGPITTTAPLKFGEIGIFRQGLFVVDQNGNNSFDLPGDRIESFGQPGDIPVAGDWTGSGVVRIGVFRPANGHWYLDLNNNGKWDGTGAGLDLDIQFGNPSATCQTTSAALLETTCGDLPIVGDWTGTGTTKLGIFRGSALSATGPGQFYLDNQAPSVAGPHTSFTTYTFGQPGDLPVAANWLGTGSNDQIGVYRKGTWYVNATGDGVYHPTDPVYSFGSAGDIGVTGNWNGNAPKRIGVFTGGGQWYVDINNDHVFSTTFDAIWNYGETGDLPVVGGPYTLP